MCGEVPRWHKVALSQEQGITEGVEEVKVEDKEQTNHVLATCGLNDRSALSAHSNPSRIVNTSHLCCLISNVRPDALWFLFPPNIYSLLYRTSNHSPSHITSSRATAAIRILVTGECYELLQIPLAKVFYLRLWCNGSIYTSIYGLFDGSPSEQDLQIDVQTALDYITFDPYFLKTLIVGFTVLHHNHDEWSFRILYGRSIGGAVSIDLASLNPSKPNFAGLEHIHLLPEPCPHALLLSLAQMGLGLQSAALPPCNADTRVADELVPKEHMHVLWQIVARREETKTAVGVELSKGLERAKYIEFECGGHTSFFGMHHADDALDRRHLNVLTVQDGRKVFLHDKLEKTPMKTSLLESRVAERASELVQPWERELVRMVNKVTWTS
ncbi:hypothetical protein B0H14DRAFT_2586752 [Mycena olivaceomarginata]|nr:hypothetical protein B0H14DRAFT_2586752 [Mycena olivaceomarginata]